MDGKKIGQFIFDFFTYVIFIFLIIAAFYFVISDNFDTFRKVLVIISPIALFLLPVVLAMKKRFGLSDSVKNADFTLYLTEADRLLLDILMYGSAAVIMFLAAFSQEVDFIDILQALTALFAILGFKAWLFKRAKE